MDISICICTFKRPELLGQLLDALAAHDYGDQQGEFVIVENDPDGSGLPVIEQWRQRLPFPVVVERVSTPNIALARNAAVHAATGIWLLIIDDDELPEPGWALQMIQAQRRYQADAVFGPVLPRYAAEVPEWIRRGGFFAPRRHRSGERIGSNETYTSNVLVRRSALQSIPGPFDADFGVTGGSDCMLFWDVAQRGGVLVWCEEAAVSEIVPRSRANLRWMLRRSYSGGQIFIRTEIVRLRGWRRLLQAGKLGAKACVLLVVALLWAAVRLPFSKIDGVRWLRTASAQIGKLAGIAGHRYRAYAT